jgi:uncharacterized membrane protein YqhA
MQNLLGRLGIVGDLLRFLWARRLWWLIPLIMLLILVTTLTIFAAVSGVGPFLYPIF